MTRPSLVTFVLAALLGGCSYGPSFRDCDIACTGAAGCPNDFSCGTEGYCRAAGQTASCAAVRDARDDIDAPPGTRYCSGAPALCETFSVATACGAQTGCAFATPTCTFTEDCESHFPGDDCDGTGGCMTYVVQPYCRPLASYCQGATKTVCEAKANCAFGGGCTGVAKPCGQLSTESTCTQQVGCTWN